MDSRALAAGTDGLRRPLTHVGHRTGPLTESTLDDEPTFEGNHHLRRGVVARDSGGHTDMRHGCSPWRAADGTGRRRSGRARFIRLHFAPPSPNKPRDRRSRSDPPRRPPRAAQQARCSTRRGSASSGSGRARGRTAAVRTSGSSQLRQPTYPRLASHSEQRRRPTRTHVHGSGIGIQRVSLRRPHPWHSRRDAAGLLLGI